MKRRGLIVSVGRAEGDLEGKGYQRFVDLTLSECSDCRVHYDQYMN